MLLGDKFFFSGMFGLKSKHIESLPLTGEVPRNEAEGAVMSQNIDRKSVCVLIQALSTASRSPSPVSGRLWESHLLLTRYASKQKFIYIKL